MMKALSEVRPPYKFARTSFLIRSIAAAAHQYHPYPAGEYRSDYYPDGIMDAYYYRYDDRNAGYLDWTRRSNGGEYCGFRPTQSSQPYWRSYREGWGFEGHPNLRSELCPRCREACYWGSDSYAPHWVNRDMNELDRNEWNVHHRMDVGYCGNMVGRMPCYNGENFNPRVSQYQQNTGYGSFYDDIELDSGPLHSSRALGSNYGMHWNDTTSRHYQESRDVYGLHGYDQNNQTQRTVDYSRNTVAESGRFRRPDLNFQGRAYPNRLYSENQSAPPVKPEISYGVDHQSLDRYERKNESNHPQNHVSGHPNTYSDNENGFQNISAEHRSSLKYNPKAEGRHYSHYNELDDVRVLGTPDIKSNASVNSESQDGGRRRDVEEWPQSYVSKRPTRSYSDNKNGFQNISAENRSSLNYNSEAKGQHFSLYNELKDGRVLGTSDIKNNASVNSGYTESQDGGRRSDVEEWPRSFIVKDQHDKTTNKISKPYQGLRTYPQATSEDATHSRQQQQSLATSGRSDWDFLGNIEPTQSPTLNAVLSEEGPAILNSGSQTENLEPEKIRGSIEELETFSKEGKLMLAVKVLDVMEKKKDRLDPERDLSKIKMLIQACGDSKAITEAKAVHKHIENLMSPLKFSLYNKILGMYLKCGAVSDACSMFYNMAAHNLTSWDTMIKGLVKNNLGEEALDVFAEFKKADSEPDGPMFLGVFSACRLVGDVIEGMLHFESMTKQYGIVPSIKHYVSIVDMMGRVGHLDEAMEFIEKMPVKPSVDVWETMMNACRIHGNTELGDRCAEVVQKMDPNRLSDKSKAGLVPLIV